MSDSSSQHRVVVDTNLVVSSFLSRTGAPRSVIQAMFDGQFVVVVTNSILNEYGDVLNRPVFATKYGVRPFEVAGFLEFVRDHAVMLSEVTSSPIVLRDDLDQKFLDAAHTARAEFLISGDNDLLVHAGDPRLGQLQIVKPRQFLGIIEQR